MPISTVEVIVHYLSFGAIVAALTATVAMVAVPTFIKPISTIGLFLGVWIALSGQAPIALSSLITKTALACSTICLAGAAPELLLLIGLSDTGRDKIGELLPGIRLILILLAALFIGPRIFSGVFV